MLPSVPWPEKRKRWSVSASDEAPLLSPRAASLPSCPRLSRRRPAIPLLLFLLPLLLLRLFLFLLLLILLLLLPFLLFILCLSLRFHQLFLWFLFFSDAFPSLVPPPPPPPFPSSSVRLIFFSVSCFTLHASFRLFLLFHSFSLLSNSLLLLS